MGLLERNQTVSVVVGTTVASLLTAAILSAAVGGGPAVVHLLTLAMLPRLLGALAIIAAGALVSYLAMRLALVSANVEQTASGPAIAPDQLRLLRIAETPATVKSGRGAQQALDDLEQMVGLGAVKREINTLIARLQVEGRRRAEGKKVATLSQHMVFTGPPGVGKTVVAQAIGDIYRGLGVLKGGQLIQCEAKDLIAGYIGQTAIQTDKICQSALDGVLFIDEAYSLLGESGSVSYGMEAINTLLTFMENYRDRVIVIVAGYSAPMSKFLDSNPGLSSRFSKTIDFPNYAPSELVEILAVMAKSQGFDLPQGYEPKVEDWVQARSGDKNWGNARSVRNLIEKMREAQAMRLAQDPGASQYDEFAMADVEAAIKALGGGGKGDDGAPGSAAEQLRPLNIVEKPVVEKSGRTTQQALDDLDRMVGLAPVKSAINTLIARLQLESRRRAEGMKVASLSQHMVFTGPPGVGKTVVAQALGDIYRGLGVLKTGQLIQCEAKDLIAGYIGQTAIKTDQVCQSALDGVLFIDEAYSLLSDSGSASFGMEAINTLLTFMENYRDRVIVIVAGYPAPMSKFLDSNPGLASRFSKTIDFPSYAPSELAQILALMAKSQGFDLPQGYEPKVEDWVEAHSGDKNWGNARSVRNLIEKMREAQAVRMAREPGSSRIDELTLADLDAAIDANRAQA